MSPPMFKPNLVWNTKTNTKQNSGQSNCVPILVAGAMSVLYSGLVMLLPEMRGVDLPETLEEVEMLKWYST